MSSAQITCVKKKLWAAYSTDDSGRLAGRVGLFEAYSQAKERAKGKGTWGGDGKVVEIACLMDVDTRDVYILDNELPVLLTVDLELAEAALERQAEQLLVNMSADEKQLVLEYLTKQRNPTNSSLLYTGYMARRMKE